MHVRITGKSQLTVDANVSNKQLNDLLHVTVIDLQTAHNVAVS